MLEKSALKCGRRIEMTTLLRAINNPAWSLRKFGGSQDEIVDFYATLDCKDCQMEIE